jgi:hypothetical protein
MGQLQLDSIQNRLIPELRNLGFVQVESLH